MLAQGDDYIDLNQQQLVDQTRHTLRNDAGVPQYDSFGNPINVLEDPAPGTRFVNVHTGKVVTVPRPPRNTIEYGERYRNASNREEFTVDNQYGIYYDWYSNTWIPYGPEIGYPFWWYPRVLYWRSAHPGMRARWGPWYSGYSLWLAATYPLGVYPYGLGPRWYYRRYPARHWRGRPQEAPRRRHARGRHRRERRAPRHTHHHHHGHRRH